MENLISKQRKATFVDDNPDKPIQVTVVREKTKEEISQEIHAAAEQRMRKVEEESGVDVHVKIDEECEDGFEEAGADEREE